jgi:hypothetical protein
MSGGVPRVRLGGDVQGVLDGCEGLRRVPGLLSLPLVAT